MKFFFLCAALLLGAGTTKGVALLSEDFAYPTGPVVGATGSPWTAHSGGGVGYHAEVVSGKLEVTSARTEDINAPLQGAPYGTNSGNSLYASFLLNVSALPTSSGSYFAHFNSTAFRGLIWAKTSGASSGHFRIGIGNTSSSSSIQLTNDLMLNQSYFVVARYSLSQGLSTLWLNPVAETNFSVTCFDSASPTAISEFAFRQASGIGVLSIDNLRIGNSFAAVTSASSVAAPIITAQPESQTVYAGATATFSVVAEGAAPLFHQWKYNGTNLPDANGTTLSLTNITSAHAGAYSVQISNNAGATNSVAAILSVAPAPPAALSVLTYNTHGNMVEDWSTNSAQVRAIGRQVRYLNADIITFQEIPATNTHQMTHFVKAFLPGYFLATNSGTDGFGTNIYIRSVIASRYPITRSKSWLDGANLDPFGYTNSNFTRDLFEAEVAVPGFSLPVHIFTTHLKSGTSSSDDAAKRAAEASAISNFFVNGFLTTNANRPYLLTGDLNEDISRPATGSQGPIQRLANPATGLHVTTPLNPFTFNELTFSIQAPSGPTRRYDYILPGSLLFSHIVGSEVFRSDLLEPTPAELEANDTATGSDHLPVLMHFANPFQTPFRITSAQISNSLFQLSWQSSSGAQYRVESATVLTNWLPFSEVITASGSNSTFSTDQSNAPATFFRVNRL